MKRLFLQYLVIFLLSSVVRANGNNIDSLFAGFSNLSDIERIDLVNSHTFEKNISSQDKIQIFNEALTTSNEIEYDNGTVNALINLGRTYSSAAKYEEALENFLLAVDLIPALNDKGLSAELNYEIGSMYFIWGNSDKSLEYHSKSLELRENLKVNDKIVESLNAIGLIYQDWKKYDVAENFFLKAEGVSNHYNIPEGKANALLNFANLGILNGNYTSALADLEEALNIFKNIKEVRGEQKALAGLGNLYSKLNKNFQALKYYKELLSISELIHDYNFIAKSLNKIGTIYLRTNSVDHAKEYFTRSLTIAEKTKNKKIILSNYSELSKANEILGDLETALNFSRLHAEMKDSVISEISISKMAEGKANLEILKNRRKIENLEQNNLVQALELEAQSSQRNFLFLLTVIAILLASIVYYRYYLKSKTNEVITAQKNKLDLLNKELNRKNAFLTESESKLKYLNSTKDKFFSIISHDLKNPFSTLIGYTDLLSEYFDDFSEEEKKSMIGEVQGATNRAYALLENLLQWSRSQRGELKMLPERIDLSMIVSDSIANLNSAAQKKGVSLSTNLGEHTYAHADYNTLSSVVKNLLSNSIKFTEEGGSVTVSAKDKGELIEVNVSDSGVSISEEDIHKLFRIDVHHTSIGVASEKGTGLGLVLCKEFVEKNGGKIWVESESGKGSDFKFTIPKYRA